MSDTPIDIDVEHTAKLAKLDLSPQERERLHEDMQQILSYVITLDELDLKNVSPTLHPIALPSVMREDHIEITSEEMRNKQLALAPEPLDSGFGVPKVIE